MNQPLKPEIIYLDKYGKLNPDWMIDRVYQIYRDERMVSVGLKEPMKLDEFIKYANTINSPDFMLAHGRPMTHQERENAKSVI